MKQDEIARKVKAAEARGWKHCQWDGEDIPEDHAWFDPRKCLEGDGIPVTFDKVPNYHLYHVEPPTFKQTLDALNTYSEWWRTQPEPYQGVALRQFDHTRRRIEAIQKKIGR